MKNEHGITRIPTKEEMEDYTRNISGLVCKMCLNPTTEVIEKSGRQVIPYSSGNNITWKSRHGYEWYGIEYCEDNQYALHFFYIGQTETKIIHHTSWDHDDFPDLETFQDIDDLFDIDYKFEAIYKEKDLDKFADEIEEEFVKNLQKSCRKIVDSYIKKFEEKSRTLSKKEKKYLHTILLESADILDWRELDRS